MQIYYLYKKGISGATSTSVIFVKYGIQMLSWTVVAAFIMGFGVAVIAGVQAGGDWIRIGGWVGFGRQRLHPHFRHLCYRLPEGDVGVHQHVRQALL